MRLRRGGVEKRTPRLDHSRNLEVTSSVTKTTFVERPISLCCSELGLGTTRERLAEPGRGGAHGPDYKAECMRSGPQNARTAKMAAPPKAQIVSGVSVCENGRARKYEHIVGQACHADEAG